MSKNKVLAEKLLDINAVKLDTKNYFQWTSGWISPIYTDNRLTLSFPEVRNLIKEAFISIIKEKYSDVEVIAGVATSGIPYAALIADKLNLPMVYVRPQPKKHGLKKNIEGYLKPNSKVLVIEDLISTAQSSLKVIQILKNNNANILALLAIFTYGFEIANKNFKQQNIDYQAITDYNTLIKIALEKNYISHKDFKILLNWQKNPENFGKK